LAAICRPFLSARSTRRARLDAKEQPPF
jgi:hypothetical protein